MIKRWISFLAAASLACLLLLTTQKAKAQSQAYEINVKDYGAACDGSTNDSTAFQNAINAATSSGKGVIVPDGASCALSQGLTATIGANKRFSVHADGLHGARLLFPAGFTGTGLVITMSGASSATTADGGFAVSLEGLSFFHVGSDTSGTAISITTSSGGATMPAFDAKDLVFTSYTGGSWLYGMALNAVNVTSVSDLYCTNGFKGVCLSYDSAGAISVEHHVKDVYLNGGSGAIGIRIGHAGMTAPVQGFTIRGLSCTGGDYCIYAQANSTEIDEIDVEGSQLNANISGIYANGADTVISTGNYFLSGERALDIENNNRLIVTGNSFYLGPDEVSGTHNISLYTKSLGAGPASGSVVSGNLFTNLYGVPIYFDTGTNYVTVSGNTCLGNQCVTDNSGNTGNVVGNNLDSGTLAYATAPSFYAGLKIGPRNTPYPLTMTADGVGNGLIQTTLTNGAGIVEIGPNVRLDGTTFAGTLAATGAASAGTLSIGSGPLALSSDSSGNATIKTTLSSGAGTIEIGPNVQLDGSTSTSTINATGLNISVPNRPYPLSMTADGVGNATIHTTLTNGAGIVEIGPNARLDGTTFTTTLISDPNGSSPASASSACTAGQTAWDSSYEYRCVATNSWKRTPLASW